MKDERWSGLGVSDGVVVGRVLRLHGGTRQVYRATLAETDVEREIRRLRAAINLSRGQLLGIKARAEKELGADHAYIFDAHLLMLDDRKLLDEVENFIRSERVNAEWAVKVAADRILAIYAEIKDDYLRERGSDNAAGLSRDAGRDRCRARNQTPARGDQSIARTVAWD